MTKTLDAAIALLGRSPGIGGTCRFQNRLFDGIRVWPIAGFKSHLIFYRILPDEIEVVRVIHGARPEVELWRRRIVTQL